MSIPTVLWGATGQAKVLGEFLPRIGYEVIATFDNDPTVVAPLAGVPIFHGWRAFERWRAESPERHAFLVAIGGRHGRDRIEVFDRLLEAGLEPAIAIHPSATVATNASVGQGCQILAGAVVGAQARLGRSTIVNTRASIDHECEVGNGVHVAPGATVCGCVHIEDEAFVGAGAIILPRLRVERAAIVGAGAVVTKDVPATALVVGNPAKVIKHG